MLITRAPRSTAQRIACASASTGMERSPRTTLAMISSADGASPAMPIALSEPAPTMPATIVPWPWRSLTVPSTNERAATIRPTNSGWPRSIPESTTATRTGASGGSTLHASNTRVRWTYHWSGARGSSTCSETREGRTRVWTPSTSTGVAATESDRGCSSGAWCESARPSAIAATATSAQPVLTTGIRPGGSRAAVRRGRLPRA